MLLQIVLERVRISLRTYKQMPPQAFPEECFDKLVGIPDGVQRLRALEWSPNLPSQRGRINKILLVVLNRPPGRSKPLSSDPQDDKNFCPVKLGFKRRQGPATWGGSRAGPSGCLGFAAHRRPQNPCFKVHL